jgi:4'-phosphopantetheinyl transferase
VQLWRAGLDVPEATFEGWRSLLGEEELRRAAGFRFDQDRRRFIAGRALLRLILGAHLGFVPHRLKFHLGAQGKPALLPGQGPAGFQFNVSHSANVFVCAIAVDRPVGVDIEQMRPITGLARLAAWILSPREHERWSALPEAGRMQAFFNAWTRKEAWLKARGIGLSGSLTELEVAFHSAQRPRILRTPPGEEPPGHWRMAAFEPEPGFTGALVAGL